MDLGKLELYRHREEQQNRTNQKRSAKEVTGESNGLQNKQANYTRGVTT